MRAQRLRNHGVLFVAALVTDAVVVVCRVVGRDVDIIGDEMVVKKSSPGDQVEVITMVEVVEVVVGVVVVVVVVVVDVIPDDLWCL